MFTSIFILILFLPAALLPLGLSTFLSVGELEEMGISLESSDDIFPMQGYELVGFLPVSSACEAWEISESFQVCQ